MTEMRQVDHSRDNVTLNSLTGLAQRLADIDTPEGKAALQQTLKRIESVSQRLEPLAGLQKSPA